MRDVHGEVVRFGINGVAAAMIHFTVLWFSVRVLEIPSAGLANICAAVVGITASFVGSRYFVFHNRAEAMVSQAARFGALYGVIALLHGLILFLWTDIGQLDYRVGFVFALVLQVVLSYWGNKLLVFK